MADYLIHGAMMINDITFCDGSSLKGVIGGGAVYAAAGAAVFSPGVAVGSVCGADRDRYFSPWMTRCGIDEEGVLVKGSETNRFYLTYHQDGSYEEGLLSETGPLPEKGSFMTLSPEEIEPFCRNIKGMYNIMDVDLGYWKQMEVIKSREGFPIMWEVATATADRDHLEDFYQILNIVDFCSLNLHEARNLFGLMGEADIVDHLLNLKIPVYFRVGVKGAYVLKDGERFFMPSYRQEGEKDPTGCGNASTAAAMIGLAENRSLPYIGAMAAVAAACNAMQYGPVPYVDGQVRAEALQAVEQLLRQ